ncbi:glycoside hydrolase family 3 protein [Rudaea cellulosilytica]|uniref:glycoside hydrolase family 3 protein n=1 Tax=Rudaea cellulosilytica TaxID=540746 RepID=UPI000375EFA1|nr:glycoside hydrolase family 3 protein [Rudaea cellulosilytica]
MSKTPAVARNLLFHAIAGLVLAGCTAATTKQAPTASTPKAERVRSADSLADWPQLTSPIKPDAAMEARIREIVGGMTIEQKIGQMTQADIRKITPDEVRRFYIGSVLNGGNTQPDDTRGASFAQWRAATARYHAAALATDMAVKIPLIWGTDAVHGHGIVSGTTVFPHNMGLGATHDAGLVREIGAATARQVRATGIDWVFAPTLAVVQNYRWGRSYESFSSDPAIVRELGAAYVEGLQGKLGSDTSALATAKHFIGDGGTDRGVDRGINLSGHADLIAVHAQGYFGALGAGAQTVMASYSSTRDFGKMHGAGYLLTDVLKQRMGFDGFVVSDWNGIAEVTGCERDNCAAAINAGIDMVMVPQKWEKFIKKTARQVRLGEIPMTRVDDAVTRILRVKMRAGLFERKADAVFGNASDLQARDLARHAVRESLVLLKNDGAVLPLKRGAKILVVGKSANSLRNQSGGWTLDWQGMKNHNADFVAGDTILAGIREAAGKANVVFDKTAAKANVGSFDAVIAVIGELPYAEMKGDILAPASLAESEHFPEDLQVLRKVAGHGKPVITVLVSGRPLYANDLINLSDAFVAAWLPGTEGKGVGDVLFRDAHGAIAHDFRGTLAFQWPRSPCQAAFAVGEGEPLFALGYGLKYTSPRHLGLLDAPAATSGCAK